MKNNFKIQSVKHPVFGVISVEKYLALTNKLRKSGSLDTSLVMLHILLKYANEKNDYELRAECRKRINKYEYNLEDSICDEEWGAASPVNREPNSQLPPETPSGTSRCVGDKTFIFSIKGEKKAIIEARLEQARKILVGEKYMIAEEKQWKDLFSGNTTFDKITWTAEKGHIIYFIRSIQNIIKNNTGFGIWEVVAAHFKWNFTYKNGKNVVEEFDHKKLSYGKPKQEKELDEAAEWFMVEKNPNYVDDDQEEEKPYSYNEQLTSSEIVSDAWDNGLNVPSNSLKYGSNRTSDDTSDFRLSDDY